MSLEKLWKLQEIDLAIKALQEEEEHTPLREARQTCAENVERLQASLAEEEAALKNLRKQLKNFEMDLQKNTASREELRKRLYGGKVTNIRELEQMEIRLGLLEKEQRTREDETLALMETIENSDAQLQDKTRELEEEKLALQHKEAELTAALQRIAQELEQLREQRETLAAQIEPRLLERYQLLAQKHQGRGLARVIHNTCGGCRVFISSAQQGLLYNPESMVYCEICGRLLVKLTENSETG